MQCPICFNGAKRIIKSRNGTGLPGSVPDLQISKLHERKVLLQL